MCVYHLLTVGVLFYLFLPSRSPPPLLSLFFPSLFCFLILLFSFLGVLLLRLHVAAIFIQSRVLDRNPLTGRLELADNAHFVFGGDAVDQGSGDLAFLEDLMRLKGRYPSRVHIVLGNRDINKMRLVDELRQAHMDAHPWGTYAGTYWRTKEGSGAKEEEEEEDTRAARLKWILAHTMGSGRTFELRREELARKKKEKPSRGIGNDDDEHVDDADANNHNDADVAVTVSDEEVVSSFIESLGTNGLLRQYLYAGKLGVIVGDTLFIHGGLSPKVMGWLPACESESKAGPHGDDGGVGIDTRGALEPNAHLWIARLNAFCTREMHAWFHAHDHGAIMSGDAWAMQGGYDGDRFPGSNVLQYGMGWVPSGARNPTLVYRDWMAPPRKDHNVRAVTVGKDGKLEAPAPSWRPTKAVVVPRSPHPDVVAYLQRSGIRRVVCGHKPHGDAALVIRSKKGDRGDEDDEDEGSTGPFLTVITVDTSYSGQVTVVDGNASDGARGKDLDERRGMAVSELLIRFDDTVGEKNGRNDHSSSAAEVHGLLCNGEPYDCFPDGRDASLAGKVVDPEGAGWIVKGRRVRDGRVLLSRLCGWDPENMFVEPDDPMLMLD